MAKVIGNGLTASFGPNGTPVFTIDVTSISLDAGERPQIDITAAADSARSAVPGLRAVPTGSVTGILTQEDSSGDPPTGGDSPTLIETIEDELYGCTVLACQISAKTSDCSTDAPLLDADIHVTGFTIDASIDEAVTITVNFMLAAGDKLVADTEGS